MAYEDNSYRFYEGRSLEEDFGHGFSVLSRSEISNLHCDEDYDNIQPTSFVSDLLKAHDPLLPKNLFEELYFRDEPCSHCQCRADPPRQHTENERSSSGPDNIPLKEAISMICGEKQQAPPRPQRPTQKFRTVNAQIRPRDDPQYHNRATQDFATINMSALRDNGSGVHERLQRTWPTNGSENRGQEQATDIIKEALCLSEVNLGDITRPVAFSNSQKSTQGRKRKGEPRKPVDLFVKRNRQKKQPVTPRSNKSDSLTDLADIGSASVFVQNIIQQMPPVRQEVTAVATPLTHHAPAQSFQITATQPNYIVTQSPIQQVEQPKSYIIQSPMLTQQPVQYIQQQVHQSAPVAVYQMSPSAVRKPRKARRYDLSKFYPQSTPTKTDWQQSSRMHSALSARRRLDVGSTNEPVVYSDSHGGPGTVPVTGNFSYRLKTL